MDAYFEENGELVIVDYKTDAIHHPEELIGRYKEQLKYYKEALEKLTAKKVKEMIQSRDELQEKSGYYKIYPQTIAIDVTNCKSAEESAHLVLENMKERIGNGV